MNLSKRWPLVVAFLVAAITGIQQSNLVVAGSKLSTVLGLVVSFCAMATSIFGEKQTRGAAPLERAGDPAPK